MFERKLVAELCKAFADYIHEAPAAAEKTARALAKVLERKPSGWDFPAEPVTP